MYESWRKYTLRSYISVSQIAYISSGVNILNYVCPLNTSTNQQICRGNKTTQVYRSYQDKYNFEYVHFFLRLHEYCSLLQTIWQGSMSKMAAKSEWLVLGRVADRRRRRPPCELIPDSARRPRRRGAPPLPPLHATDLCTHSGIGFLHHGLLSCYGLYFEG